MSSDSRPARPETRSELSAPPGFLEERDGAARADRCHAGNLLQPDEQTVEVRGALGESAVLREVHVDLHRQDMVAAETGVDAGQFQQAAHHQPRADEQHERRRDLGDDERAPQIAAVDQPAGAGRNRRPPRPESPRHGWKDGRDDAGQ